MTTLISRSCEGSYEHTGSEDSAKTEAQCAFNIQPVYYSPVAHKAGGTAS